MVKIFPHVQLYLIGDNFLFVGSDASLDDRMLTRANTGGSLFDLSDYPKLSFIEDLLAVLQLDEAGCRKLAEGHRPITDDRNLMATGHLPGTRLSGALNQQKNLINVLGPLHYLNRDPGEIRQRFGQASNFRYLRC